MSELRVDRVEIQPETLELVRNALPVDDPYRANIEDHRAELQAHHHPITYTVSDTQLRGYAMLCQIAHKSEAVLEIVIAPYENENAAIDALLERVLDETTCPISWWTRAPRHQDAGELGAKYGGTAHRSVLRMERALDAAIESDVKSRAFVDEDAGEVIRINNEAFSGHPDRSQLTEDDVYEKLRVQGNRYEDLRMTNGAFCWTKRHSINESEIFVLAVDNEHRHLGLGGNLLRSTLEFIRTEHHVPLVSLYVEHDNTKAIALYKQNGFADTEKTLHSVVFPAR